MSYHSAKPRPARSRLVSSVPQDDNEPKGPDDRMIGGMVEGHPVAKEPTPNYS